MKINRFVSGLAGLVLAACGQENNTNNNSNGNNDSLDGGYSDSGYVNDGGKANECTLDSECGNDKYCDKTVTPYVCKAKQGNLPPVVIIEAKDDAGNVKTEFNVGEQVTYDFNKSYDPDCEQHNSCGQSRGMDHCLWHDDFGNSSGTSFPPTGRGFSNSIGYGTSASNKIITITANCYTKDNLESEGTIKININ